MRFKGWTAYSTLHQPHPSERENTNGQKFAYSLTRKNPGSFTHYKLIWIFVDVKFLQIVIFSIEKGLNGKNHSLSDSHHPIL